MKKGFALLLLLGATRTFSPGQSTASWASLYNGAGIPAPLDKATALAVDTSGNLYVTGQSTGNNSNYDYLTVRYNHSGDTVWTRRYSGPGNGIDVATDIALDKSGNVYVTGYSTSAAGDFDYATIKYSPSGVQLWVARYDGPTVANNPGYDLATAIAIDGSGNACVTGKSTLTYTAGDFLTVKYNPSGDTLWTRRFEGPDGATDQAYAIRIDAAGNVYVAGYVDANASSGARDFCTIKYGPAGEQRWVARYDGPDHREDEARALDVDAAGNVYVVGLSDMIATSFDYVTVKYDSTGSQKWASRYFSSPTTRSDTPYDIAVDASGNAYVTGFTRNAQNWPGYLTIKYNALGDTLWTRRYEGPGHTDAAYALELDSGGNVYVTGESQGTSGPDILTIKYDASGTVKWMDRYDRVPGSLSQQAAYDLAVSKLGEVFVTGSFEDQTANSDYLTVMYASTTDVRGTPEAIPGEIALLQNYPNPFNPSTTIRYELPRTSEVRLSVYDMLGREVAVFVEGRREAGVHEVVFDASGLSSGVYFYSLQVGDVVQNRKLLVLK